MTDACAKCGSKVLVDVKVVTNADHVFQVPLSAMAYLDPDALIAKKPRLFPMRACVCRKCGFCELYVDDPQGLAAAMEQRQLD